MQLALQVAGRTVGPPCSPLCCFSVPRLDAQLCAYSIPGGSIIVQQVLITRTTSIECLLISFAGVGSLSFVGGLA